MNLVHRLYFSLFAGATGFAHDVGDCAAVEFVSGRSEKSSIGRFSPGQRRAHVCVSGYIPFCEDLP